MTSFLLVLLSAIQTFSLVSSAGPVVSNGGREGLLVFQATVYKPENDDRDIPSLVDLQTKHLLGVLEQPQFSKINGLPANDNLGSLAIGPIVNIKVLREEKSADGTGTEVTYAVQHKMLIRRDVMDDNASKSIKIILPHDPVEFYSKACTDEQYYEKDYLFYYWNPFKPVCLQKLFGKNQVDYINAEIQTYPTNLSLAQVTPNYSALKKQILTNGELKIALLFGLDLKSTDPKDNGRISYEYFQRYFESKGFEVDHHRNTPTGPFTEYVRPAAKGRFAIRVSMSLSASDINSPVVFARRAREAFETADIVDYVGHAGLGGNLNLEQLTRLSSPDPEYPVPIRFPGTYQIYYLDSCASFFFYSKEYAAIWQGAHNVDLVTNGVATFFYTQNHETLRFLEAFTEPKGGATWQAIVASAEDAHPHFTYLINVNGIR